MGITDESQIEKRVMVRTTVYIDEKILKDIKQKHGLSKFITYSWHNKDRENAQILKLQGLVKELAELADKRESGAKRAGVFLSTYSNLIDGGLKSDKLSKLMTAFVEGKPEKVEAAMREI